MLKRLFEPWPKHHHELRAFVSRQHRLDPSAVFTCALRGYYLPHGGKDEVLIRLRSDSGHITRIRTPQRGPAENVSRDLDVEDRRHVEDELVRLGVWRLGHARKPSMDGWACAVAATDGERVHSIQTHNPEGEHLALICYILGLAEVASDDWRR